MAFQNSYYFSFNLTEYIFPQTHYVDWDFDSKNTSHFQFLQKPFILDVCKPLKKIKKILFGTSEIFAFIRFGIAWNFFSGYKINFLSTWPFMRHPCVPPKRSQKWHFLSFSSKIATAFFVAIFWLREEKWLFWDLFRGKTWMTHKRSNA